jgi:hypothetical protein
MLMNVDGGLLWMMIAMTIKYMYLSVGLIIDYLCIVHMA